MSPTVLRMLAAVFTSCGSTLVASHRLARIPEPDDTGGTAPLSGWQKPVYAGVVSPLALVGVLAAAALLPADAATLPMPLPSLIGCSVLAGAGGVLALCDLRTTYLPNALLRPIAIAVTFCSVLSIAVAPAHRPARMLGTLLAAMLATSLFWTLWRLGAGLGFGDVRLAGLLALASAPISFATWYVGLLAGTCLGAIWGLATAWWRRRHPSGLGSGFPYGPALWLGAWAGLLLS